MASRAPRQLFAPSLRASARSSRTNVYSSLHASRRAMSSTAEAAKKSSDMPWIIGSAVVFGPAFLYLVSPASRKSAPHHDSHGKHDKKEHKTESMPMKDDEGTETDVSESVAKAESDDVPNADSAEKRDKQEESAQTPPEDAQKEPESTPQEPAGSKDESGPTEQGQVRDLATQSGEGADSPKGIDEKINSAKDESS